MKSKFLTLLCSLCFIFSFNAAHALEIKDAVSFDPVPIKVQAASLVPIGTVAIWTKEEIPEGWLECNGQAVNADLYPELAYLMPNVPDYRDKFLQGKNLQTVGSEIEAGLPNITGTFKTNKIHASFNNQSTTGVFKWQVDGWALFGGGVGNVTSVELDASLANPVYGKSETVQPPAVVVKYIIKAE